MINNKEINKKILKSLNWRYATKIFDKKKKVNKQDIQTILESARLSPSSLGLEAWKFFVIKNKNIRAKIFEASKQPKILDASHLIVITYRTDIKNIIQDRLERTAKIQNQKIKELDKYKDFLENSIKSHIEKNDLESWIKSQAYIPLGIMILTASLLKIDNGPMEGFDNRKVDEILKLEEKNLKSVTMLALGYRGNDPINKMPKIRKTFKETIEII